jgi:hypothetical protein
MGMLSVMEGVLVVAASADAGLLVVGGLHRRAIVSIDPRIYQSTHPAP